MTKQIGVIEQGYVLAPGLALVHMHMCSLLVYQFSRDRPGKFLAYTWQSFTALAPACWFAINVDSISVPVAFGRLQLELIRGQDSEYIHLFSCGRAVFVRLVVFEIKKRHP